MVILQEEKKQQPQQQSHCQHRHSIIRDFCLNTSTHALPGIARSESMHNRLFWAISFTSFTLIMIYFIVKAILAYFEYPTQIDINYISERPQYFPAFTLCNASPLRLDKFKEPFFNYLIQLNLTDSNDTSKISTFLAPYIGSFIIEKVNNNESLEYMFYPLSAILQQCSFNGKQCYKTDFLSFISPAYGLCHTFNAKLKDTIDDSIRYGNANGGDGNLQLGLYVHSHQYVPYVNDGIGIIGLVHDNTQLPLIDSAGIELAPGRKHKLGYKKKTAFFARAPYTTCTDEVPILMHAMFDNYNRADYGYSEMICYQICGQVYAYKQCGCVSPFLWNSRSVIMPDTNKIIVAPLCTSNFECYTAAVDRLLASQSLMNEYCSNCSQQCLITNFIVQTSSLYVPFKWLIDEIKNFVENSTIPLADNWTTDWREHIKENYLLVNVVRETTIVENNTQIGILDVVDVLSNIGGQTGLWIGISFLSIMEIIEMLYRLIRYECVRFRRAIRKKKQVAVK